MIYDLTPFNAESQVFVSLIFSCVVLLLVDLCLFFGFSSFSDPRDGTTTAQLPGIHPVPVRQAIDGRPRPIHQVGSQGRSQAVRVIQRAHLGEVVWGEVICDAEFLPSIGLGATSCRREERRRTRGRVAGAARPSRRWRAWR